jgi:hypothetical protein
MVESFLANNIYKNTNKLLFFLLPMSRIWIKLLKHHRAVSNFTSFQIVLPIRKREKSRITFTISIYRMIGFSKAKTLKKSLSYIDKTIGFRGFI